MLEIKKSIEQGFGPGGLFDILVQLKNGMLPNSGETYYVSTHGNNTTGLSWENAFTTVNAAIIASNAYLDDGANTYKRNKILIDSPTTSWYGYIENITVIPRQCDVIGVGSGLAGKITIQGTHTIATAGKDARFYNIRFLALAAGGAVPVFTAITGCYGIEFHNCEFKNYDGNTSTTMGLLLGASHDVKVNNCKFLGNPVLPIGIQVDGPQVINCEIIGCFISATTTGIKIANGVSGSYGTLIKDNIITRADPNVSPGDTQLVRGIAIEDTAARDNIMKVHNWIAAADAIYYQSTSHGTREHWTCIENHVVQGETADTEDDEHV